MSKRYLVIVTRAPGVGALAREAIDLLLVAGAFDLDPAVLFTDRGVRHLAAPPARGGTGAAQPVEALPTYGITKIYVDAESLRRQRLARESLLLAPTIVEGDEIGRLIADCDIVLTA